MGLKSWATQAPMEGLACAFEIVRQLSGQRSSREMCGLFRADCQRCLNDLESERLLDESRGWQTLCSMRSSPAKDKKAGREDLAPVFVDWTVDVAKKVVDGASAEFEARSFSNTVKSL